MIKVPFMEHSPAETTLSSSLGVFGGNTNEVNLGFCPELVYDP